MNIIIYTRGPELDIEVLNGLNFATNYSYADMCYTWFAEINDLTIGDIESVRQELSMYEFDYSRTQNAFIIDLTNR